MHTHNTQIYLPFSNTILYFLAKVFRQIFEEIHFILRVFFIWSRSCFCPHMTFPPIFSLLFLSLFVQSYRDVLPDGINGCPHQFGPHLLDSYWHTGRITNQEKKASHKVGLRFAQSAHGRCCHVHTITTTHGLALGLGLGVGYPPTTLWGVMKTFDIDCTTIGQL